MTAAERRALLGDATVAHIHREVEQAPTPAPTVIADLRRVLTRPAGREYQAAAPQRAA